jgi:two-component system NtrC family sensor kinase
VLRAMDLSLLLNYLIINHKIMKTGIKILLLLLAPVFGSAQDSAITISPAMFNKPLDNAYLSPLNGWIFKQGNDTAWAEKDINTSGWKKLRPADLSAKYADKNGKLECWFRIKIKLDKALDKQQLGLRWISWAAADIYINGARFSSFGNTGQNGKPYAENQVYATYWPRNIDLKTGIEYTIAVHFVDYLDPSPLPQLKSEALPLNVMLDLAGPKCYKLLFKFTSKTILFNGIWVSACTILSLLFWLLSIQNPAEKELRLIAVFSTFFASATYFYAHINLGDLSYLGYWLDSISNYLLIQVIVITTPVVVANVLKRTLSRKFKGLLIVTGLYTVINFFLPQAGIIPLYAADLFLVIVCIYYVVSSWQKLRGAQWCIVAGLLSSLLFFIAVTVAYIFASGGRPPEFIWYLNTGFLLSFPLSMLVYVAMRFKDIIKEVRQNAQQVVLLSEEKKQEALNRQKILEEEVSKQTAEIRATLANLKSTQTQLIQSEKMASLGELTAGIAHEIQNPLNFVNNFSEVNTELIDEMQHEIEKGDLAEIKAIANDIQQNEQKINMHGKRADAIVKGMLQHSKNNSGKKELTDINALSDEYLRLSYHGLRAKDKTFNAEMITNFNADLPKVNVIPQDIGRVLLNLFNNAFYAVNQKQKTAGNDYKPEVSVTTSTENGQIIIKVKDNGIGISENVKDKIMQPFFTTKPTGEGTGLGLSLTYDMVVKGHGGSIFVDTKEGEFTEFEVQLPIQLLPE